MKMPDEIKKGLESCGADECHGEHTGCPYKDDVFCIMHICGDALAYINQLEARATKWISVKDRLPESGEKVIARLQSKTFQSYRLTRILAHIGNTKKQRMIPSGETANVTLNTMKKMIVIGLQNAGMK